jgi:hypothetical protein
MDIFRMPNGVNSALRHLIRHIDQIVDTVLNSPFDSLGFSTPTTGGEEKRRFLFGHCVFDGLLVKLLGNQFVPATY